MKCFGADLVLAFRLALGLAGSGLFVACSATVDDPQGGGGAGAGGGGANAPDGGSDAGGAGSGGSPTMHDVELDIDVPAWLDANEALVVLSSVTGDVKATFRGSELPAVVSATDGDLVSYVYRSGDLSSQPGTPEEIEYVDSLRIRPEVKRVARLARPYLNHVDCVLASPMQVTVDLPEIPGASAVSVDSPFDPIQYVSTLPGSVTLSVGPCAGTDMFDIMVVARDDTGALVSYERLRDIVFDPGGAITLDASVSDTDTRPLQIDVVNADGAAHASGTAIWLGGPARAYSDGTVTGQSLVEWLEPFDADWTPPITSFSFAPALFDLEGGNPIAAVTVRFEDADAPCVSSSIIRRGSIDTPIDFDARGLGLPEQDASGAWAIGPGGVGHVLTLHQRYPDGNVEWRVADDPLSEPLPVVFPSIDVSQLPEGVVVPPGPFEPSDATHSAGYGSFAEIVADAMPPDTFTTRSVRVGSCD